MLVAKADLLRPLRAMAGFDPKGSPYAAVQLPGGLPPQLFRSSGDGTMQTGRFDPAAPATYVGLSNFVDVLRTFPSESVELSVTGRGILRIGGDSAVHDDVSHVHTVSEGQAGTKRHDTGPRALSVDPLAFSGLDVRPFGPLISPPVLAGGKLMLPTGRGAVVVWRGERLDVGLKGDGLYPREAFLRYVTSSAADELEVTANGYWGAAVGDMVTYSKGHRVGRQIFDLYDAPGRELARMPAERLVSCLNAVLGLVDDADRVDVDPRLGVVAKGRFGDSRHPLGETGTWDRFGMQAKAAKVVSAALSQAEGDYATLESAGPPSGLRLRRGAFEVIFRGC